ncbi:adhesion G protein-coupled receptor E1 [Exaiptasia diaphana]|uniref:EGF-like domain-containing protein n=1 Tax=Exaiptasia diaphana TaxID=2652724 RepID=A0A913X932_EXADI|nr:adhesion G protein-coupled receptor E1 [Exaiptasia diaphana]
MEVNLRTEMYLLELLLFHITQICTASVCRTLLFKEYLQHNKMLLNHVISNHTVNTERQCRFDCYDHHDCISYNTGPSPTQPGMILCQLNDAIRHQNPLDYVNKLGFSYRGAESPCTPRTCLNGGICQTGFGERNFRCICSKSFEGDLCQNDKDECKEEICPAHSTCVNSFGSFSCFCKKGFEGNGFLHCTDIDECSATHNCSSNATCTNTLGSYRCECNVGYSGDGFNCTERNECQLEHNCSIHADCLNVMGSYSCQCRAGFRGNGWQCRDIDECSTNQFDCPISANCENKPGTYTCVCPAGYEYQELTKSCNDTDECNADKKGTCPSNSVCRNSLGSYSCNCLAGFVADSKGDCKDIDECNDPNICQLCLNTEGSFSCYCSSGFAWNGHRCIPQT